MKLLIKKSVYLNINNCPILYKGGKKDLSYQTFLKKEKIYQDSKITFVACSQWLENMAKKSHLIQGKTITSVPNAINTNLFKPRDKNKAREKCRLPLEKKLLLFGSVKISDKRKGIDYLLESCNILSSSYPDFCKELGVVVVGKDAEQYAATSENDEDEYNLWEQQEWWEDESYEDYYDANEDVLWDTINNLQDTIGRLQSDNVESNVITNTAEISKDPIFDYNTYFNKNLTPDKNVWETWAVKAKPYDDSIKDVKTYQDEAISSLQNLWFLEPNTEAAATITGTAPDFVLNLTIPQGPTGPAV